MRMHASRAGTRDDWSRPARPVSRNSKDHGEARCDYVTRRAVAMRHWSRRSGGPARARRRPRQAATTVTRRANGHGQMTDAP
jgi:hypothetical protein